MNHRESVLPTLIINSNERTIFYGSQRGLAMDNILHFITPVVMTLRLDHFIKVGDGH
jgi:hypothetical protein